MRILLPLLIIITQLTTLTAQDNQPEIRGILNTGETLTAVYSSGIFTRNAYVWETADDQSGTQGVQEVGKTQTYKLRPEDAGKYIRLEVTSSNFWGRKTVLYSGWKGPVKNSVPLIKGAVTISGTLKTGYMASANYVYDPNNYSESGTTFKWYMAEGPSGARAVPVSAGGSTIELQISLENKYLRVEIIPKDINGVTGNAYTSSWYGPIQKTEQVNNPPVATGLRIRGNPVYCGVLTGLYDYSDSESDAEGESSFRWLRASGEGGTPEPIPNATSNNYTVTTNDKGKFIYFEVTPKAVSGNTSGAPVMSNSTSLIQGDLPTVTFSGATSICEGTSAFITLIFTGNPPFNLEYTNGIKTSGLTTSNYSYQLAISTGGTYKGTKLTDVLNCPVTNLPSSLVIASKPLPLLDFSVANTCYTADSTIFNNTSSPKANLKNWSWNFGDAASSQNTSSKEMPKHKYPAPGTYQAWLAGENTEGCRDTTFKTVTLGEKPAADIAWNKECFTPGMNVSFQNKSISNVKISKYAWTLSNSGSVIKESSVSELTQTFASAGKYDIKLKVTTELGCADSIMKVFAAKPIIRLQDGIVTDDFESNPGWTIELNTKNNWALGKPTGTTINSPHSGTNAFYTSFPEKRQNQQLVVTSSCYDFTGIQTPFAEMWVNYSSPEGKEGAVLQYTQDGAQSWTTIGGLNTGFNWYNHSNIAAKPGSSAAGWTGTSKGWVQVRHNLDLGNKTNMRFRLVYASAPDVTAMQGFAFDDFYIGQRSKKVLVEYFTNLSDAFSNQSNFVLDSILNKAGPAAIPIQYHTSFPGPDSLNDDNKANPSARTLFYGIGKVPAGIIDGGNVQNYAYDFSTRKMSSTDIVNRSFEDPGFSLKITPGIQNNIVTGTIKLTALRNLTSLESTLQIAIVEDISIVISGKPITLKNVLKYMYPSAGGSLLASTWMKDQTLEIPFSWNIANVYNNAKTKVVAFIQHNPTKEIYQAEMVLNTALTSSALLSKGVFNIYPNPASENIWIDFGEELETQCLITIINTAGKTVMEKIAEKGISISGHTVADLPPGLYYLRITAQGHDFNPGRFVITR